MRFLVEVSSFDRKLILRPQSFNMNQSTLPSAKDQVLQGGNWNQLIVGVHGLQFAFLGQLRHEMDNLKDSDGNIHPAIRANYSATVELLLHVENRTVKLHGLGPGFAHFLFERQAIEFEVGEIETIISGKSSRWKIRFTSPITGGSKRFTFDAV